MLLAYYLGNMTGRQLARWIRERGLTQRKAAELIGVTEGAVSRWVKGNRPIPTPVERLIATLETAK